MYVGETLSLPPSKTSEKGLASALKRGPWEELRQIYKAATQNSKQEGHQTPVPWLATGNLGVQVDPGSLEGWSSLYSKVLTCSGLRGQRQILKGMNPAQGKEGRRAWRQPWRTRGFIPATRGRHHTVLATAIEDHEQNPLLFFQIMQKSMTVKYENPYMQNHLLLKYLQLTQNYNFKTIQSKYTTSVDVFSKKGSWFVSSTIEHIHEQSMEEWKSTENSEKSVGRKSWRGQGVINWCNHHLNFMNTRRLSKEYFKHL